MCHWILEEEAGLEPAIYRSDLLFMQQLLAYPASTIPPFLYVAVFPAVTTFLVLVWLTWQSEQDLNLYVDFVCTFSFEITY
jgi:hypothetical protein